MFRILLLIGGLCASAAAPADVIVMTNGDKLTGRLDSIGDGVAKLETTYAGTLSLDLNQIQALRTRTPFLVRLASGVTEGFFINEQGQQVQTPDRTVGIKLADIRSATPSLNGATEGSRQWGARLDLALSLADGNTTAEASNVLLEADYAVGSQEHSVTALIAKEEGEGLVTKDQLDIDYGYRRFISERWYGAANAGYFQDTLKDIDSRITLGAGVGVQLIDSPRETLASDLSLSAVQEDIDGSSTTKPAMRLGVDYQRFFQAKTIEVFSRQSVLQLLEGKKSQVISSSTGIRYAFNSRIDTAFRVDVAYESDPPADNKKTDTTYSLGVGLKF